MEVNTGLVDFRKVVKSFDDNRVLEGLDLSIRQGEVITIMGGSGSGKSVLLRLMLGLLKPDSGQILVAGEDIVPLKESQLHRVRMKFGMLFQSSALFDSLTVADNIAYPLRITDSLSEEEIDRRVQEKLALVGLSEAVNLYPAQLSGGMKKRVALARAIARQPDIILYDEPTTGLDPANVNKINSLIKYLQKEVDGLTSVVVTHDIESAFKVSDRLALLSQGQVVALGTKEEMVNSQLDLVRDFLEGR
ncbi:MAG: ATP-binding cassette domain-containing protein [Thermodesulfobacteriota bacterium]